MRNYIIASVLCTLCIMSCTNTTEIESKSEEITNLQVTVDSLKTALSKKDTNMYTFFTFQKEDAELAMNFYMDVFENAEIINVTRWGANAPSKEGTIMQATFSINGKLFMCSDSPPVHEWGFTPAVSNFIDCTSETELDNLFAKLSENGKVMMPPNNYGFSQKFGFLEDQFGVSWQLNLP
ncbi:MAG: VOC family protein [bacterium]